MLNKIYRKIESALNMYMIYIGYSKKYCSFKIAVIIFLTKILRHQPFLSENNDFSQAKFCGIWKWQDFILHLMEFIVTKFHSTLVNFLFLKFSYKDI